VECGSVPVVPAKSQAFSTAGRETIRVTIVSAKGFQIRKKRFKKDIPDIYVQVKFGSSPTVWRTTTVKDNVWKNEYTDYTMSSPNQVISLEVMDANRKGEDGIGDSAWWNWHWIFRNDSLRQGHIFSRNELPTTMIDANIL